MVGVFKVRAGVFNGLFTKRSLPRRSDFELQTNNNATIMKILVAIKRVVDYNVKVHVLPDHSDVDIASAKMSMNPFDEIAVEQAVRMKEKGLADEVVVVSIGGAKTVDTLRVALAMGADRAVHVNLEGTPEPLTVARILKEIARRETPDVILFGKQAIDNDAGQVPQMVSAMLDMPVATNVSAVELEGTRLTAVRETDSGLMRVAADLPVVISADLRLAEPRYVTLPNMMKAKKKPVEAIAATDLVADVSDNLKRIEVVEPPARAAGQKLAGVDQLIDVLKNKEKVL